MQSITFRLGMLLTMVVSMFSFSSLQAQDLQLSPLGTYESGVFDEGAVEIAAYDPKSEQLFVTNADANSLDVIDISDPSMPTLVMSIDLSPYGGGPNSVAIFFNKIAVAVEDDNKQENGKVVFFDRNGNFKNQLIVGALPDMLTFTPNGKYLIVANEGEPNDEYTIDPEGSISVIKVSGNVSNLDQSDVKTATFTAYNNGKLNPQVRVFGPGATPAQDFEPEYIAVSSNSKTAWVVLQENNAIAKVSIPRAKVRQVFALGSKDHMMPGNGIDASNRDDEINIANWPVHGLYMPDAIEYFKVNGQDYLITANEGDSRDYDEFSEEERVKDLDLDPVKFPEAEELQEDENLGRLKITTTLGDTDGDGDYDELYSYGARSFSIWDGAGNLVFDSGDEFEQLTAAFLPEDFNSTNDENGDFDGRSDDKGPEPEGVTVGEIDDKMYAFIGLERVGGIMVYDISDPYNPEFVQYINVRDFSGDAEAGTAGDLGPEGLVFIEAADSPTGSEMLAVANEVSGTVTLYDISLTSPARLAGVSESAVSLNQNYPNPFTEKTQIGFTLNEEMPVRLMIFNLEGQLVNTLIDQPMAAGTHELKWNGTSEDGNVLPAGMYFYRLEAGNHLMIRKMMIVR